MCFFSLFSCISYTNWNVSSLFTFDVFYFYVLMIFNVYILSFLCCLLFFFGNEDYVFRILTNKAFSSISFISVKVVVNIIYIYIYTHTKGGPIFFTSFVSVLLLLCLMFKRFDRIFPFFVGPFLGNFVRPIFLFFCPWFLLSK